MVSRWRLDETEGPYRVRQVRFILVSIITVLIPHRKKLEHDNDMPTSKVDHQQIGDVSVEVDTQSIMQLELPPWSESYELSVSAEDDGKKPVSLFYQWPFC